MTLSCFIKKYRLEHNLSQRQFAILCNVSNGYISMLEDNKNPKTGEPIVPSITTIKKIAKAMGLTLNDLLRSVDDMDISLYSEYESTPDEPQLTEGERFMLEIFRQIPEEQQQVFLEMGRVYANSLKKD